MVGLLGTMAGVDLSLGSEGFDWLFDGFEFFLFLSVGWFKLHLFLYWLIDWLIFWLFFMPLDWDKSIGVGVWKWIQLKI